MIHNSRIFDFYKVINEIREEAASRRGKGKPPMVCEAFLETITEDVELEDLVCYKEYLSAFEVEKELEGFEFSVFPLYTFNRDDVLMLVRFAAASFATDYTYSLEYNFEKGKVDLLFNVVSPEKTVAKKLDELYSFRVSRLFKIFLEEQLNLQCLRDQNENERRAVDERRGQLIVGFLKKVRLLKKQRERLLKNQSANDEVISSLDALLAE